MQQLGCESQDLENKLQTVREQRDSDQKRYKEQLLSLQVDDAHQRLQLVYLQERLSETDRCNNTKAQYIEAATVQQLKIQKSKSDLQIKSETDSAQGQKIQKLDSELRSETEVAAAQASKIKELEGDSKPKSLMGSAQAQLIQHPGKQLEVQS